MDRTKPQSEQINIHIPGQNHLPPLVRDAVSLMEAEFAYLYGIDELADRLEITKHHLIRVFSASTGISPGNYLTGVRMSHAKRLLQSCDGTPMEIIAGACGYSCGNYFSKVFKKHTGLTPTEYMKSAGGGGLAPDGSIEKFYL
ncbi:MAG TPA: AraC family transcriptional regulator [Anaerovoracaceae bacterium]|nr:AraC family transcriptional regulator [Anaerovoracaceae bacterium]